MCSKDLQTLRKNITKSGFRGNVFIVSLPISSFYFLMRCLEVGCMDAKPDKFHDLKTVSNLKIHRNFKNCDLNRPHLKIEFWVEYFDKYWILKQTVTNRK